MVAYSFKAQFAALVESGEKRQTIRPIGKRRHARVGEAVQLYTGMRTKACRKLAEKECHFVYPISIIMQKKNGTPFICQILIDRKADGGLFYFSEECIEEAVAIEHFAEKDGFRRANGVSAARQMADFFTKEGKEEGSYIAFRGILIIWGEKGFAERRAVAKAESEKRLI